MAQDIKAFTGEAGAGAEKKRGFRPFAAMAEGLRSRRARRDTLSLLEAAMRFEEKEASDEAMSSFAALSPEQKGRVMAQMEKMLKTASYLPFESEDKVRRVAFIAEFFSKAATMLPVDSEGERITAPHAQTVRMLKDVVEHSAFRANGNPLHSKAVLACAKALWELEYGSFSFWEARTQDAATCDYTITKLLEMPDTGDFEAHGWFLLRKNLDGLGIAIARNPSEKKEAFFRCVLMDGDNKVVKAALRGAVHLEAIPADFPGIAQDVLEIEPLETEATNFISATHSLGKLSGKDPYPAIDALALLYRNGMKHLKPVLERAGKRMAQEALGSGSDEQKLRLSMDALAKIAAAGIAPCSADALTTILGPLVGSRASATEFFNLTGGVLFSGMGQQDLAQAAAKMESDRVNSCFSELGYADERQFPAALELVALYSSGRMYLVQNGMIPEVAKEMVELVLEPAGGTKEQQDEQVRKAHFVLEAMRGAGIDVQINHAPQDQNTQEASQNEG